MLLSVPVTRAPFTALFTAFFLLSLLGVAAGGARAQPTRPDTVPTLRLGEVQVRVARPAPASAPHHLPDVQGTAIYAGRRTDVVPLSATTANLATGNARQVLARVPGVNIIENDNTGVQLGLGVRGLNPARIQEFNARQNGYDIAADPFGYPESYYTPPAEALDRIELVRGAASLQYGPQYGGLLNFVLRPPDPDRRLALTVRQTVGAFGLSNTFARVGGTVGRLSYTGFGLYKRTDGWRANNGVQQGTGYGLVRWQATERLSLSLEMTAMRYDYQQPGGRTDAEFATDPRGSNRARNWFRASWLLPAVVADWTLAEGTVVNVRTFGLVADRLSLGNLAPIDQPDTTLGRNLLADEYRNLGLEARLRHDYTLGRGGGNGGGTSATLVVGVRAFRGRTTRRQGNGPAGDGPDFRFLRPADPENFDYRFPSSNGAVFAENLFRLGPRLTLTPGARLEYLRTDARGAYYAAGQRQTDAQRRTRTFPLLGLSAAYALVDDRRAPDLPAAAGGGRARVEAYASVAQSYAAVSFNDLRVANPNFTVDPNLRDSRGYTAEAGLRGALGGGGQPWLTFDVGGFWLQYNDRVGIVGGNRRTNIADARSVGVETLLEFHPANFWHWYDLNRAFWFRDFTLFASHGYTDARYVRSENPAFRDKRVELVPRHVVRAGASVEFARLSYSWQVAYTAAQFADATNARVPNAAATVGLLPAFVVQDVSVAYRFPKRVSLAGGVNNLTDRRYFTRRATGYPGPGILPSDGRAWYASVEIRL